MTALLHAETLPTDTLTLLRQSAADRNVSVEVEAARLVKEGLARNGYPPVRWMIDWGPPHIIADIEFPDPPGVPVVPVDKGPARFELCCDINDPSQRVPE